MSLRIAMTFPLSLGTPGGGPQDCFELCRNMSLAGADVTLLAVAGSTSRFPRPALSPENSGAAQAAQLAEAGVRVIHVPPHPIHFRLDGLPMRKAVKRLLSERDFDVLIGWWHEASFLHSLTRARRMVFAINAAASYRHIYERLRRRKVGWLLSGPLRKADVIFVRSDFTQRELVECVGVEDRHVRKIHCGVRPGFFEVPRSVPEKIDRLVYFGSLTPAKGVFDLIAALGRLTDQDLGDWRLRIIGFGDQDPVRAAAREHGVIDRVEILGGLGPEELMGQLEWARMAVLPSRSESFGLAVVESQAAGLPVIAYDAGAVPEVLADGVSGWLVPVSRTDLLAQAIATAMRAPEASGRIGLAGRERVARLYAWERTAEETLTALEETRSRIGGPDFG